jgi:hypothetical protein
MGRLVSATPQPLYAQGKHPGVLQCAFSWSGRFGEGLGILPLPGMEPAFLGHPAHNVVTLTTELLGLWVMPVTTLY